MQPGGIRRQYAATMGHRTVETHPEEECFLATPPGHPVHNPIEVVMLVAAKTRGVKSEAQCKAWKMKQVRETVSMQLSVPIESIMHGPALTEIATARLDRLAAKDGASPCDPEQLTIRLDEKVSYPNHSGVVGFVVSRDYWRQVK